MALLFLRNVRQRMGPVDFVARMKVYWKVQLPMSNWSWTVLVGAAKSPYATCNLKVGGSICLTILSGLTDLIFSNSLSGRELTTAPESMSASIDKMFKSIGANRFFFFFRVMAKKSGRHCSLVFGLVMAH